MIIGIDHVVILVRRLEDAIRTYQDLGFQVVRGGEHPGGSHNALIGFADGAYFELIAFQEPEKPHDHRWYHFLRLGGGPVDFALLADDVEQELQRLQQRGLDYTLKPGARKRPDGQEIAWRMAWPPSDRTGELPFLIDDVTPRELRVPSGDAARHPNCVTGIASLAIAVRDLQEATGEFAALTNEAAGQPIDDLDLAAQTVDFSLNGQQIVLAYPTTPSSPIAARIQRKGDGPFQITLTSDSVEQLTPIAPERAEGSRLVLVPEQ